MIGNGHLGYVGLGDVDVKFMSVCSLWAYIEHFMKIQ